MEGQILSHRRLHSWFRFEKGIVDNGFDIKVTTEYYGDL